MHRPPARPVAVPDTATAPVLVALADASDKAAKKALKCLQRTSALQPHKQRKHADQLVHRATVSQFCRVAARMLEERDLAACKLHVSTPGWKPPAVTTLGDLPEHRRRKLLIEARRQVMANLNDPQGIAA